MRLDVLSSGGRWTALLLCGVVAALAYVVVPYSMWSELSLYDGVVALSLVASLVGARRAPRGESRAWLLSTVALGGFLLGELTWWGYGAAGLDPFPSIADVVFLVSYVPLGLAAAVMAARGDDDRDRSAWLDAGVVTAVAGLVVWDTLIDRYVSDPDVSGATLGFTIAYPLVDILVLGLGVRLLFSRRPAAPAGLTFLGGLGLTLAADLVFAWQDLAGIFEPGSYLDLMWLLGYLMMGFAPHLAHTRDVVRRRSWGAAGMGRLALVVAAVAIPQAILAREIAAAGWIGLNVTTVALAVASVVLVLVSLRLWSLLGRARRAEARRGERRLEAIVHHLQDAVMMVDAAAVISFASRGATPITGRPDAELVGCDLLELFEAAARGTVRRQVASLAKMATGSVVAIDGAMLHEDGTPVLVEGTACNLLEDGDVGAIVVTLRDVTDRRRLEEQLERKAFNDDLTGLANRALFIDRVAHALDRARRVTSASGVSVIFVDLDDFKAVNDGMGHGAGDELIRGVAGRLRACVRPADTVARLGGDEFAVLLEDVPSTEYATGVARRLLEVLQLPIDVSNVSLAVPASIGVTLATAESTVESLLRDADTAMYEAKSHGKGRIALFDDSLRDVAVQRLAVRVELPEALRARQFRLAYQPIRAIGSDEIRGFEALIRWNHPQRGLIAPADFIPAAEETGAIVEIGRWVIETACRQAVEWNRTAGRQLTMSVNVSGVQLHQPAFVDELTTILEETGLPASCLILEITESVLVDHQSVTEVLERLRRLGVGIAVDDFGTGYSSLSYLKQFPVTSLKVDRSFVADLTSRGDAGLVASIMSIADALGLTTVAEGVETSGQLEALGKLDCGLAQGYYLGRPQSPDELGAALAPAAMALDPTDSSH